MLIDHAAAGSQFVPKLTGGVNRTEMNHGVTKDINKAPSSAKPKTKFKVRLTAVLQVAETEMVPEPGAACQPLLRY